MSGTSQRRDQVSGNTGLIELFREAATLHQQGRLDDAARHYAVILSAEPRRFDVLHRLGVLRAQQGRLTEAETLLRQAIDCNPSSGPAHSNLGMTLNLLERHQEAILLLKRAIKLAPQAPLAHNNLGNALQALRQHPAAAACFERAVALKPDYVEALSNLGAAFHTLGRGDEAINLLEKALVLNPNFAPAHLNLGIVLRALERREEARACFERALSFDAHSVFAWRHLGALHLDTGRSADARRCYERALEMQPQNAGILYDLVQCGRVGADDAHLATLESLAENAGALSDHERIRMCFGVGKAYADLGQNERSFRYFQDGNALTRRGIAYDEAADVGLFERIRAVFSAELMRSRTGLGNPSERPIFIVGMMRSGSSLIEQILASHPDVFGAGERHDFNQAYKTVCRGIGLSATYPDTVSLLTGEQLRRIGDEYLGRIDALAAGRIAERITDKMPGNFSYIGLIPPGAAQCPHHPHSPRPDRHLPVLLLKTVR
jgi:tetratricopeptide (TPR) repeat protein